MQTSSADLARQAEQLRYQVNEFLADIRAAQRERLSLRKQIPERQRSGVLVAKRMKGMPASLAFLSCGEGRREEQAWYAMGKPRVGESAPHPRYARDLPPQAGEVKDRPPIDSIPLTEC